MSVWVRVCTVCVELTCVCTYMMGRRAYVWMSMQKPPER